MAEFIVDSPDGKQFYVKGPDGSTLEEAIAFVKNNPDKVIPLDTTEPSLQRFSEKSFPGRVADVALGVFEPAVGMVLGLPGFVESVGRKALQYGKEALTTGVTPETEARAAEAASQTIIPMYHPYTETGKLGMEGLSKIFEWIIRGGGRGVAEIENIRRKIVGQEPLSDDDKQVLANIASLGLEAWMAKQAVTGGAKAVKEYRRIRKEQLEKEQKLQEEQERQHQEEARAKQLAEEYQKELIDLDNTLIRYPKDLQAPQLGMGGRVAVPPDASRKGAPPGGERYTQETVQQDLQQLGEKIREAQEAPLPFDVPFTEIPVSFEFTQRGGPPRTVQMAPVRIPDWELEALLVQDKQPTGPLMSMREGTPFQPTVDVVPSGMEAIPRNMMETTPLERVLAKIPSERELQEIRQERDMWQQAVARSQEDVQRLRAQLQREPQNREVAERLAAAEASEARAMEQVHLLNEREKTYIDEMIELEKSVDKARNAFVETTFDSARLKTAPRRGPRKQMGVIHPDLLTFGVSALLKTRPAQAVIDLFHGTYNPKKLVAAIRDSLNPTSTRMLVWINPQDFLRLAADRPWMAAERPGTGLTERYRASIRQGLETIEGLADIPYFIIDETGRIVEHEGRHRMDVFIERGLDQVPIILQGPENWKQFPKPDTLLAQDGALNPEYRIAFPQEVFKPGENLGETLRPVRLPPLSQRGSVLPQLLGSNLFSRFIEALRKTARPQSDVLTKTTPRKAASTPEILELAAGESRTPTEFRKSLKPEDMVDIPDSWWSRLTMEVGNAAQLAHLTGNKIVQYWADRTANIMRMSNLMTSRIIRGLDFKFKGIPKHVVAPDSPEFYYKNLTAKELQQLVNIANEYNGIKELTLDELYRLGANDKVAKAYKAFVNAYKTTLEYVNERRIANNLAPIQQLPGYFAKARHGDIIVRAIDRKTGETLYADLFFWKWQADRLARQLRERLKDRIDLNEVDIEVTPIKRETRGNPYNIPTVAMEELLNLLSKNDQRTKIIESVIHQLKGRRGFMGAHAIHRKNVPGGDLTPSNFFSTFTDYVEGAMRYAANLELKANARELIDSLDFNAPRLKGTAQDPGWIQTYTDVVTGSYKPGAILDGLHAIANGVMKMLTFGQAGPTTPARFVRNLNNYFMLKSLFFYRPGFLAAQLVQPDAFAPQILFHYRSQGFNASVLRALYEGEKLLLNSVTGLDRDFINFIRHEMARGEIDPQMIHEMDLFGMKKGRGKSIIRWLGGITPAQGIESFGRLRTAAIAYAFFKEAGLRGRDLWNKAEEATKAVMVDYSKYEQPQWIGKTGLLGTAAGPLSTFVTHYAMMTMLFFKDIAKNPTKPMNWMPMMVHLLQSGIWGGLVGAVGMAEVDLLFRVFRDKLLPKLPTSVRNTSLGMQLSQMKSPLEWLMSNPDIPDPVTFGIISGPTGINLGGSMAAPEFRLPGLQTFPGIQLLKDMLSSVWEVLDRPSMAMNVEALKTVLPTIVGRLLDIYEVKPVDKLPFVTIRKREYGEVIPDEFRRSAGKIRLTPEIEHARKLGTVTTQEKREQYGVRALREREALLQERKANKIELALDKLLYNVGDREIEDLMIDALENDGMSFKQFIANMKRGLRARLLTQTERAVGSYGVPRTPHQFEKYQYIEQFRQPAKTEGASRQPALLTSEDFQLAQ